MSLFLGCTSSPKKETNFYDLEVEKFSSSVKLLLTDLEFLKKHLNDADIVHHLAGITDVAYVKSESNSDLDKRIISIGVDGTNNLLKSISKKCKIIFPSTHVVYEGVESSKKEISENESTSAFLAYAIGKVNNEEQIKNCGKKYVIYFS